MRDIRVAVPGGTINIWNRPAPPDGDTVALIHGLSGTSRWWSRVIDHLPAELGLVALDVRGRGASYDSPPPFDLATVADDVARSLDHLAIRDATIAGYSMGGWIAAVCAQRHPDRVRGVVLVDGGFAIPSDPDADADAIIETVVGASLARIDMEFANHETFYDQWKSHPALAKHWDDAMKPALGYELIETDGLLRVRINPQAVRETARQITVDPQTRNAGAGVNLPAHLIVVERGTADQSGGMIPLQTAEKAATEMPNLTMQYLPGVNHYTLLLGAGAPAVASAISTHG